MRIIAVSLLITCLVHGAAAAQSPQGVPPKGGETPSKEAPKVEAPAKDPKQETPPAVTAEGVQALRRAKAVAAGSKGLKGGARVTVLEQAIKAYQDVLGAHGEALGVAARAHYEMGELHRRLAALAPAAEHYRQAAVLDPGRYAGRGWYGVGQMQRRLKDLPKAIAAYTKAAAVDPAGNRAADARIWIGRCHVQGGDRKAGLAALRAALEAAKRPGQVIQAADWLAKELVKDGDLKGAEAALGVADRAVADSVGSSTEKARLTKKLGRMGARKALRRAQDAESGAAQDAQDVEREGVAGSGK